MIAYIKGILVDQSETSVLLENNGIAYEIFMSNPYQLSLKQEHKIFTYQHVREDAILLFGFPSMNEKQVFLGIINVKGIGPKTAMNILSKTTANEFLQAIENEDLNYLKTLPGIGKKTASQILLDLKGKMLIASDEAKSVSSNVSEALEALKELRFTQGEIRFVEKILNEHQDESVDKLIKIALQAIASRSGK